MTGRRLFNIALAAAILGAWSIVTFAPQVGSSVPGEITFARKCREAHGESHVVTKADGTPVCVPRRSITNRGTTK